MTRVFETDVTKVGVRKVVTRNPETKKLEEKVTHSVARVFLPKDGREGIAVNLVKHKEDIVSVVVQYTDCAPGDVVGERCIREGEQRQHHVEDVVVLAPDSEVAEGKEN